MSQADYLRRAAWRRRRRYGRAWGPAIGGAEKTVTFPETALVSQARIALGADLSADWRTWNWLDITDRVRWDDGVEVSAGRREQADRVDSGWAKLKADNRDSLLSRKFALGPYFGLLGKAIPLWLALNPGTGFADMFFGFIVDPAKRWDRSARDSVVFVTARGLLHLLLHRQPLHSPMFYTISGTAAGDYVPHVYIPLEDGASATQAASAISSGPAATVSGDVTFASDDDLAGSSPLPFLAPGSVITIPVPAYTDTSQWVLQIALRIDAELTTDTTYVEVDTPGGDNVVWRLYISPGSPAIVFWEGYNSSGALTNTGAGKSLLGGAFGPSEDDFFGTWWFFTLSSYVEAGQVWGGLSFTDNGAHAQTNSGTNGLTVHAPATEIRIFGGNGVAAGHAALFTNPNFNVLTDAFDNAAAMGAWDGEMAHQRIARLCREQQISLYCQATTSAVLGPQPTGTLLDVFRDAEKADLGVLYEHEFGLAYQALSERFNQPVAFTIDVAQGQLAGDLEPDDNDLRFRNQWTAQRSGGSEATVQARDGDAGIVLSESEPLYDFKDTFSVQTDGQLPHQAGWLAHRDSLEEDYWPGVEINLAAHPELIGGWLAMRYGQRLNVLNVMEQAGIETIDALREGRTEEWNSKAWVARMNTAPAATYTVGELDDTDMRLDSGTSTLTAAVTAGASSFSVSTSDSRDLWSTDSADYPQDVTISGIHVTVTAVSGAASPQTFTVTGSTVLKNLNPGDEVHVRHPFVLAR